MLTEMTVPYFTKRKLEAHFYKEWASLRIYTTNDIDYYKKILNEYFENYEEIAVPIDPNFDIIDLKKSMNRKKTSSSNGDYKLTDNEIHILNFYLELSCHQHVYHISM